MHSPFVCHTNNDDLHLFVLWSRRWANWQRIVVTWIFSWATCPRDYGRRRKNCQHFSTSIAHCTTNTRITKLRWVFALFSLNNSLENFSWHNYLLESSVGSNQSIKDFMSCFITLQQKNKFDKLLMHLYGTNSFVQWIVFETKLKTSQWENMIFLVQIHS